MYCRSATNSSASRSLNQKAKTACPSTSLEVTFLLQVEHVLEVVQEHVELLQQRDIPLDPGSTILIWIVLLLQHGLEFLGVVILKGALDFRGLHDGAQLA
jgi:hypothetical protein